MINFDQIELDCDINRIEIRAEKFAKYFDEPEEENFEYPNIYEAIVCNNKANEQDDLPEERRKGTRKVTNRAERRAATRNAKSHLREIYPYAKGVCKTYNGAIIHKGNTYGFLQDYKKLDRRQSRYSAKSEIAAVLADIQDDYDEWDEWELDTLETFPEREDGCIDIDKFIDEEDDVVYVSEDDDWDDDDDWDYEDSDGNYIERRVWNDDLHDHVYVREETELGKTRRELAQYKEFIDEFNLNTLFERWLADKEK